MSEPKSHDDCSGFLQCQAATLGAEVDVFTTQPHDWGQSVFDTISDVYTCPHGQRYWIRPSLAQQREWWRNGTQ